MLGSFPAAQICACALGAFADCEHDLEGDVVCPVLCQSLTFSPL